MLYGILTTLFCILGLFIILLVMVQRGHGGFWSGPSNSESAALFGGSGGSDILQKITWICGFLLIVSTFFLSIYRTRIAKQGKYTTQKTELKQSSNNATSAAQESTKEVDKLASEDQSSSNPKEK